MNKFFKTFLTATVLTLANSAFADDCANDLKLKIDFAYNDGGLSVENTVGPIYWNESEIKKGNPHLKSKVAFAVSYSTDPKVLPDTPDGNVFISAECSHDDPSKAIDTNEDGVFDLNDTEKLGQ